MQGYSKAIDIWSVGCIAGTLLVGEPMPFDETADDSQAWDLDFVNSRVWQAVSRKARSFTQGCLVVDEARRFTSKQALSHDWFTDRHYAQEM